MTDSAVHSLGVVGRHLLETIAIVMQINWGGFLKSETIKKTGLELQTVGE